MTIECPLYRSGIPLAVPLKKKKWVVITRDILRREGKTNVQIFVEPSKWFVWKKDLSLWERFKMWRGKGTLRKVTLGTHILIKSWRGDTQFESIHFREEASKKDMMDTIVHEVAHVLTPANGHDTVWQEEYRRLQHKYTTH